jgi:hypothetical protein
MKRNRKVIVLTVTVALLSTLMLFAADTELAARKRAEQILHTLRQRKWKDATPFVIVVTGKRDALTRSRMGIGQNATRAEMDQKVSEWFRHLYDVVQPGTNASVRIDTKDNTLALVTYHHDDLDGFHMRLVDGQWYYTLE